MVLKENTDYRSDFELDNKHESSSRMLLSCLNNKHWVTKKLFLKVVYVFSNELGSFCIAESKIDIHFSQSVQVFFYTNLI